MAQQLLFSVPPYRDCGQATGPVAVQGVRFARLLKGGCVRDEKKGVLFSGPTTWVEWLRTPEGTYP